MNRVLRWTLLVLFGAGCSTALSSEGAKVRVFGAEASAPEGAAALFEGCRVIQKTAPFDQQESERAAADPYRRQRNDAAGKGGNVLLVYSQPIVRRPSTDCAPRDQSPGCLESSQSWNRVSFGYLACTPEAVGRLETRAGAAGSSGPIFSWTFGSSRVAVTQMKTKVLEMMHEGVGTDVIVSWVRGQRLKQKLSADDIIDWKKSGIDEKVIQAALGG